MKIIVIIKIILAFIFFGIIFFIYFNKKRMVFIDQNESQKFTDEIFKNFDQFNNEIGYYYAKKDFLILNDYEKTVVVIWELETEVNNGGFHQYFFNSSGDHSLLTVSALDNIESKKFKTIMLKALSYFPNKKPVTNQIKRQSQMEKWEDEILDELSKLDDEFYKYEENISELLYNYYIKNKIYFRK